MRKTFGSIKLIKRDSIIKKCISERFPLLFNTNSTSSCRDRSSYNQIANNTDLGEKLNFDSYDSIIKGTYGEYNNSGISVEVPFTYLDFTAKMDKLVKNNWVNNQTYLLVFIMNSYSANTNKIIMIRGVFEFVDKFFEFNLNLKISDMEIVIDPFMILAILSALICLIFEFLRLKISNVNEDSEKNKKEENNFIIAKLKNFFNFFKSNFKAPTFFDLLSNLFYLINFFSDFEYFLFFFPCNLQAFILY